MVGWLSDKAGTLFIKRGAGQTEELKRQMIGKLDQGYHVLLFPEGTTTDGKDVRPFFPRLFALAQETGHAIQPISLRYSESGELSTAAPYINDDVLVPHILRVLKQDTIDVDIHFMEQLDSEGIDRKSLAKQAHSVILSSLNSEQSKESVSEVKEAAQEASN